MANDGFVDVGPAATLPNGIEPFPGAAVPLRHSKNLEVAASKLAARSPGRIFSKNLAGTRRDGIGARPFPTALMRYNLPLWIPFGAYACL